MLPLSKWFRNICSCLILLTLWGSLGCKTNRSQHTHEAPIEAGDSSAATTLREPRLRFEQPSALYLIGEDASTQELVERAETYAAQASSEFALAGRQVKSLVESFKHRQAPAAPSSLKRTQQLDSTPIPTSKLVRQGAFTEPTAAPRQGAEIELIKAYSNQGMSLPVRMIHSIDDLQVGMGEKIYIDLSKKQYELLEEKHAANPPSPNRSYKLVSTAKDGSDRVRVEVADMSIERTEEYLRSKRVLMFNLEDTRRAEQWDKVKEDLEKTLASQFSFSLGEVIGRGAFGEAFLVKNPNMEPYVIKKMSTRDPEAMREVAILTQGTCAGCLQYYGAFLKRGEIYLASEYAPGGTLVPKGIKSSFKREQFIELMRQAKQLADKGMIHKDLKPENIFIGADGKPKIADWGIAQRHPTQFSPAGTPYTIPPEVFKGSSIEPGYADRVHTFAVAMAMLEAKAPSSFLLNNRKLAENNRKGVSNVSFLKKILFGFSKAEREILEEMLEPDYKKRLSISEALQRWQSLPTK
ncbi:MAG: protein kinase [Zetaproteobacteria bacterium]|nr:protein kinase [Zetaproteobacteria bacterium]